MVYVWSKRLVVPGVTNAGSGAELLIVTLGVAPIAVLVTFTLFKAIAGRFPDDPDDK